MMMRIETERLLLREWKESDKNPFFKLNQDSRVMEFFPALWDQETVNSFMDRMNEQLIERQYTLWAVEEKKSEACIGFIGLNYVSWNAHFTPCVEIGWRLAYDFWGQGFAPEGAFAVLDYAFQQLKIKKIVAFTTKDNYRSRRVMEKIGMTRDIQGDFLHPKLQPNHPLALHVLYTLMNEPIR